MKPKIMLAILMLIAIKNFSQNISLTASATVDSLSGHSPVIIMEQRQILYRQIIKNEISHLPVRAQKNFMRSSSQKFTIDTDLVVPKRYSV